MKRSVVFSPEALSDLRSIYIYIAERSGDARALGYTDRIKAHCMSFSDFAERGSQRDDLRPGLRVTGFERRVAIALHFSADAVTIDRILYGGRNLENILSQEE